MESLIRLGSDFYSRGWLFGTSGNLSIVLQTDPLRLAITASGLDKGRLDSRGVLEIDGKQNVLVGTGRPSSETSLHLSVIRGMSAGAVFHTHSTWSTMLSEINAPRKGIRLSGFEMLKGLEGVRSHDHSEWIPILDNSQDMESLSDEVDELIATHPDIHAFILRGHGLYTWGKTAEDAKRHVEVIEFLLEVTGRLAGNTGVLD